METQPRLRAAAQAVVEHLRDVAARRKIKLPANQLQKLQSLGRTLDLARKRNWQGAAMRLRRVMISELERMRNALRPNPIGPVQRTTSAIATPDDVDHDLAALVKEFVEVEITPEQSRIAVTTAPIVIEGLELGPFEIWLYWNSIGHQRCYRVLAVSPHPPASDECVTHPYVRDDILCAGKAERAIELALQQGRIFDFFMLVRQLLVEYVPGRSYVEPDQWNWLLCEECASLVHRRDQARCERCNQSLCTACANRCAQCERTCCGGCSRGCVVCRHRLCRGCLDRCQRCSDSICADCHVDGTCSRCLEADLPICASIDDQPLRPAA
jgi:hypothetical protein